MPGKSSWYSGTAIEMPTKEVVRCYGDGKMPEHMRHIQDFQRGFSRNANAYPLLPEKKGNRGDRLKDLPAVGRDPIARWDRVRDEKNN